MRRLLSAICAVVICLMIIPWFAADCYAVGNGGGTGGGAGASVPLWMDWCYPANGETNVSTTVVIQCKYSHNIALNSVGQRNITKFVLKKKSDGTSVNIDVYTADTQVEFDKRQFIYVRPVKPLENNTTYVLTAKEGIQSKNGMVTAADQSFEFTTGRAYGNFNDSDVESMITDEEAAALGETVGGSGNNGGNTAENTDSLKGDNQGVSADNTDTADVKNVSAEEENHNKNEGKNYLPWFAAAVFVLAVLAAAARIYWLRHERRRGF